MIGKVTLPQDVSEAIELYLKEFDGDIAGLLDSHADKVSEWASRYRALNGISQADMARAVLIGYEVESGYEVGDWVAFERVVGEAFVGKIEGFEEGEFLRTDICDESKVKQWFGASGLRHATPEEIKAEKVRRVWAKIGREVGEFRNGDIRVSVGNVLIYTKVADFAKGEYLSGELRGFYPAESFISFEEGDSNA